MFQTIVQTQRHDLEKTATNNSSAPTSMPAASGWSTGRIRPVLFVLPFPLLRWAISGPSAGTRGSRLREEQLLNGIVTEVDVTTDLYANLRPTLIDGLRVEHQCRLRAVAAAGPAGLFCNETRSSASWW